MTKSTLEFLQEHAKLQPISFHMPGHKGAWLYREYGYGSFLDRFMDCDITEIPGADNLFQSESILACTQRMYAELYGVEHSYMLINGTSGGIIAAILASVEPEGTLIMARNCHKSVFNAMTLGNIQPAYIYPELIDEYGISGEITPQEVERAICENPQAAAIILPSPNYYGICSDIKAIAEVAHRYGKVLIVDQAHGAHLKWLEGPECAENAGADIVINSIHKTLASYTQSAVLNLNSKRVDRYVLEDKLQAIQSTSPSYLLMASLDINADLIKNHGTERMKIWNENLDYIYEEIETIDGLKVIRNLENLDRSKINLDTSTWGITAAELEERLMEQGIFSELTTGNILMLMTGIGNRRQDFEKLIEALKKIRAQLGELPQEVHVKDNAGKLPQKRPMEKVPQKKQRVPLEEAAGKICASSIIPYPPGIPLICPGEVLQEEDLRYIRQLRDRGEKVIGINDTGEVTVGA